jgi:hypothetical protein
MQYINYSQIISFYFKFKKYLNNKKIDLNELP